MTSANTPRRPVRLWPGVAAAVMLLLAKVVTVLVPDAFVFGMFGAILSALAILVWWLFFSRTRWFDRLGALVLMIVAMVATSRAVHPSIAGGMMGLMFPIFAVQTLSVALVAGVVASRPYPDARRRASAAGAILLGCGVWVLVRTDGVTGSSASELKWRWTPTAEDRLLAQTAHEPFDSAQARRLDRAEDRPVEPSRDKPLEPAAGARVALPPAPASAETPEKRPAASATESAAAAAIEPEAEWPGFRGPLRDGIIRGVQIQRDWSKSPPSMLWRRAIGPGWSSFAVRGDFLYTQEQRGNDEIVGCYKVSTGEPIWRHRDAVRFYESNGGAGPRATPTLSRGRVYTVGATGILNALDAGNGAVVWSRNVASDTGTEVPTWGFSSSPLVVDDVVIVAASGTLAAYDRATGSRRWVGPPHESYSSPHLLTIDGVPQVVMMTGAGAESVAPADGTRLWEHKWEGVTIVQPAQIAGGDLLISTSGAAGGIGIRRLAVARGAGGWTVVERWTSNGLKPYFNDFVVHKGHAFGFDGSILACIDLADGKRTWKGGRYGNGQLVLLSDQDLLLVLSEEGELALVKATPEQFTEVARFPALDGKTWNHPVQVGNVLLVRNGQEMAAFRLSLAVTTEESRGSLASSRAR